jgi:phosphate transport system permease protein
MASNKRRHTYDVLAARAFRLAAIVSVLTLVGIFAMLLWNGLSAFNHIPAGDFFSAGDWNPAAFGEASYGIWGMVLSTLMVTAGAMVIAIPIGIGTAAFMNTFCPKWLREVLKPLIEMLAAIPSVAVGFIGIVMVSPVIAGTFDLTNGLNALNGSILLAIMSLPTIITISDEAIRAVPNEYREASLGMGATRWQTLMRVTLPACYSGLIAASMLGLGRAVGETMTVLMAAGNAPAVPEGYTDPVRTMTATIAIELGEVPQGTAHYYSLFAIGIVLFLITLVTNVMAERIAHKYRKKGR